MEKVFNRLPMGGTDVSIVNATENDVISPKNIVDQYGRTISGKYNASNLSPANVRGGILFGVGQTGSFTNDATAIDDYVLAGKTYGKNGEMRSGGMPLRGGDVTDHFPYDGRYYTQIPWGFYDKASWTPGGDKHEVSVPIADVLTKLGAKKFASGVYTKDCSSAAEFSYTSKEGTGVGLMAVSNTDFINNLGFTPTYWYTRAKKINGSSWEIQYTDSNGLTYYYSYNGSIAYARPYLVNKASYEMFVPAKVAGIEITWYAC